MPARERTLRDILEEEGIDLDEVRDNLEDLLDAIETIQVDGQVSEASYTERPPANIPPWDFSAGPLTSRAMELTSTLRTADEFLQQMLPAISALDRLSRSELVHKLRSMFRPNPPR